MIEDVQESAGAAPADSQASPVEQEYAQVNENFRRLADIRFKLLAFVPALGGVAVYVLVTAGFSAEGETQEPPGLDHISLVALIAAAGFFVTLGIVFYDQRNSELYNALIDRAKYLEGRFRLPRSRGMPVAGNQGGQFNERPGRGRRLFGLKRFEMAHETGLALIYGPVLGAWVFPFLLSVLTLASFSPYVVLPLACSAAVIAGVLFTAELLRLDREDYRRRARAELIKDLASSISECVSDKPPESAHALKDKVDAVLTEHRDKLNRSKSKWSKTKLELVRNSPDRRNGLLIECEFIHDEETLDKAIGRINGNIEDKRYPTRSHILLLAYDPHRAIDDEEERRAGDELGDRCTVRMVRLRQQAEGSGGGAATPACNRGSGSEGAGDASGGKATTPRGGDDGGGRHPGAPSAP